MIRPTGKHSTSRKLLYQNELLITLLHLPRGRKELQRQTEIHQICVPSKHTKSILKEYHEILGHFSAKRLFPSLQQKLFWRTMAADAAKVSGKCDTCQRSKIITNPNTAPLNPLDTPTRPYRTISFDHKVLTRRTLEGNSHLLVCDS